LAISFIHIPYLRFTNPIGQSSRIPLKNPFSEQGFALAGDYFRHTLLSIPFLKFPYFHNKGAKSLTFISILQNTQAIIRL
jgi:hypothetical protein